MKKFNYVYIYGALATDPKKIKMKKDHYGNYIFDCNYLYNEPIKYSNNTLDFSIYVYNTEPLDIVSKWGDNVRNIENSSIKEVFDYIKELYSKGFIKDSKSYEILSINFYEISNSKAKYISYLYKPSNGKLNYNYCEKIQDDKTLLF